MAGGAAVAELRLRQRLPGGPTGAVAVLPEAALGFRGPHEHTSRGSAAHHGAGAQSQSYQGAPAHNVHVVYPAGDAVVVTSVRDGRLAQVPQVIQPLSHQGGPTSDHDSADAFSTAASAIGSTASSPVAHLTYGDADGDARASGYPAGASASAASTSLGSGGGGRTSALRAGGLGGAVQACAWLYNTRFQALIVRRIVHNSA